jgi:hypothetical protein
VLRSFAFARAGKNSPPESLLFRLRGEKRQALRAGGARVGACRSLGYATGSARAPDKKPALVKIQASSPFILRALVFSHQRRLSRERIRGGRNRAPHDANHEKDKRTNGWLVGWCGALAQAASANCGLSGDKLNATLTEQNRRHSAAFGSMGLDLLPFGIRTDAAVLNFACLQFVCWCMLVTLMIQLFD